MDPLMIIGSIIVLAAIAAGSVVFLGMLRANGGDTPAEEMDQRLEMEEKEWRDHGLG